VKALALNSSPNKDRGGTGLMLNALLDGLREAGASVELQHIYGLTVRPCLACFDCWLKTPGTCRQRDEMQALYPKIAACDVLVFATPLYADGMNAPMKALVERCLPLLEPFFEIRDGHCQHPVRSWVRPGKVVLVAACGFTELDNFEPLLAHVRALSRNLRREFAGALLRPYAAALPDLERMGVEVADIYEAARRAGRELVEHGAIRSETAAAVSRELVRREVYVRMVNARFRRMLGKARGGAAQNGA